MKRPRKPKMAKYPKSPKRSASLQTIAKTFKGVALMWTDANREKVSAYNKKISEIAQAKRMYDSIRSQKRKVTNQFI